MTSVFSLMLVVAGCITTAHAHGRLLVPVSRASMWRYGFKSPTNYDDNQLFCGGFNKQWGTYGGRCGVCGDSFEGPRDHEAPSGKYAQGIIVRKYSTGQDIDVVVHLTVNHKGWFEFRLCQNENPEKNVTQSCFDQNLLYIKSAKTTRLPITPNMSWVNLKVSLPPKVTCSACVLQWKYNTGNSWGTGEKGSCVGCGPQEQFYGCADISIGVPGVNIGEQDKAKVLIPAGDDDESDPLDKYDKCVCNVAYRSDDRKSSAPLSWNVMSISALLSVCLLCQFV